MIRQYHADWLRRWHEYVGSGIFQDMTMLAPPLNRESWDLSVKPASTPEENVLQSDPAIRSLQGLWLTKHSSEFDGSKVSLSRLQARAIEVLMRDGVFVLPNMLSVHAVVITEDGQFILSRRSAAVAYNPGRQSASFEEGVDGGDQSTGDPITHAAQRGMKEEFGINQDACGSITVLGALVEVPILNPAIIVFARIRATAKEVRRGWLDAGDKAEMSDEGPQFLPFTKTMASGLVSGALSVQKQLHQKPVPWHPTSRVRMPS